MDTNQDASGENTQLSSSNDFPIDSSGENLQSLPKNAIPYGNTYVEQYKAAAKSLRDNKFLAILPVFMISKETVDKLRSMQATYLCRQQHRIDLGFGFLLATVWDHDRLWGEFNFGLWHGTLCIDEIPSPIDLEKKWQFEWRGARTDDPGVVYKGTGSIRFTRRMNGEELVGSNVIGEFVGFKDVGINDDVCSFEGLGPCNVARDITDMLYGWNCLRDVGDAHEEPRQSVEWETLARKTGTSHETAEEQDDD
ncbi:hypothetical protein Vi05172_g11639 [Venturia inaequalis]|nr:hypothetical protein Vi05172_g11639 [Venturia inaequalis]